MKSRSKLRIALASAALALLAVPAVGAAASGGDVDAPHAASDTYEPYPIDSCDPAKYPDLPPDFAKALVDGCRAGDVPDPSCDFTHGNLGWRWDVPPAKKDIYGGVWFLSDSHHSVQRIPPHGFDATKAPQEMLDFYGIQHYQVKSGEWKLMFPDQVPEYECYVYRGDTRPTFWPEPAAPAGVTESADPADTSESTGPADTPEPSDPADTPEPSDPADTPEPSDPADAPESTQP